MYEIDINYMKHVIGTHKNVRMKLKILFFRDLLQHESNKLVFSFQQTLSVDRVVQKTRVSSSHFVLVQLAKKFISEIWWTQKTIDEYKRELEISVPLFFVSFECL